MRRTMTNSNKENQKEEGCSPEEAHKRLKPHGRQTQRTPIQDVNTIILSLLKVGLLGDEMDTCNIQHTALIFRNREAEKGAREILS